KLVNVGRRVEPRHECLDASRRCARPDDRAEGRPVHIAHVRPVIDADGAELHELRSAYALLARLDVLGAGRAIHETRTYTQILVIGRLQSTDCDNRFSLTLQRRLLGMPTAIRSNP